MKTNLSRRPVLSALLDRAALGFVDIGGRGAGFKNLFMLAPYAHYFVCEPESAEASRLREILPTEGRWRAVTVFGDAIASRRGEAALYITRRPGMSSLLQCDAEVTAPFFNLDRYDVERIETVSTIPLDEAAERHGFTDACFVKLDTQGTELDIMRSGDRLVSGPALGVWVEANMRPFYKGQSLFADLDAHLRSRGFSLFMMNRTGLRRAGYRSDIYSKRVVTWAHCLYLREPSTLLRRGDEAARRDLPRLLALALAFQYFDLTFEIIQACASVGVLPAQEQAELLHEMERLSQHITKRVLRDATNSAAALDMKESLLAASFRDKSGPEGA
jgi:FkbM family methyltransferase